MFIEKTEGITLQSIAYKEQQRILTIFTKKNGLLSLILKGISSKKPRFFPLNSPFCLADFVYKKGRSDIYFLQDVTILNEHLFLRKDLQFINSAYLMAKAILDSQMPQKQSSPLYLLLKSYLKKIPVIPSQNALLVSFLLKLLLYEGFLHLKTTCNICEKEACFIHQGECLCQHHGTIHSHPFTLEELKIMQQLAKVTSFETLQTIDIVLSLKEKVLLLFKDLV